MMQGAPEGQQMPPQGAEQQMAPQQGQGGGDEQMQAIMQQVASMMEQGADPATIIGGLLQSGIPPEIIMQIVIQTGIAQDEQTASQMIQEVMGSMQGGQEQAAPQEEQMASPEQMMQLGGESDMNAKIAMLAELSGASVQDITDKITAAIEQSGDASEVELQIDQAIADLQAQQSGVAQAGPQDMPVPMARYGGPTAKDFREVEKEMIQKYKQGGATKNELDSSNTQSYLENLKGAISNWTTANNKIGLVRQRTERNLSLFDELPDGEQMIPVAQKGLDLNTITDVDQKAFYTTINDKFKDYKDSDWAGINKAYNEGKMSAEEFQGVIDVFGINKPASTTTNSSTTTTDGTTTNTGTKTTDGVSANAMQGETYAQWANRNKIAYGGQYSDRVWNGNQWVDNSGNQNKYYYPGYNGEQGWERTPPFVGGWGNYNTANNGLLRSIESLMGAVGPKTPTGNYQIKGVEGMAGKSQEDVIKRFQEVLADPEKFQYAVTDVRRKNIFGKEKKGDRNIIGKRVLWSPTTGQPINTEQSTTDANQPVWDPATNTYVKAPSTSTQKNTIIPTVDEVQLNKDLQSEDKWTRKAAEDYFADQEANTTPRIYTDEELKKLAAGDTKVLEKLTKEQNKLISNNPALQQSMNNKAYGASLDAIEQEYLDFAASYDLSPEEAQDPSVRQALYDAMEGAYGNYYPNPDNPMNQPASPVPYAKGGQTQNGAIVWDFDKKRFLKNARYTFAKNGAEEDGFNLLPEMEREIDWQKLADGTMEGAGWLNQKAELIQGLTSNQEAADQRQGMFQPISPAFNSGNEGSYTQTKQLIAQDAGVKDLSGTGTDETTYTDGYQKNFYKDMNPGGANLFFKNGGPILYAEDGIELDAEYELTDDDIMELEKLGYKIERLGYGIEKKD